MPAAPEVDLAKSPDAPLTERELTEVKRQLAFLRRHREVLRLKLNAHEDLLVGGRREPDHRGRVKHLMSKLDRQAVESAVLREPLASDAVGRARFLGQAAAMSGDIAVTLAYLDALVETGEAGDAFSAIVDRIDFGALSAARLGHMLSAMEKAFPPEALPQALFGLLRGQGFREVFDAHSDELGEEVARRFIPLRAVNDAIYRRGRLGTSDVQEGVGYLLSVGSSASQLASLPGRSREGIVRAALAGEHWRHPVVAELAAGLKGKSHSLVLALAERLIRDGTHELARPLLRVLGDHVAAKELLSYLDRDRAGPFVLLEKKSNGLVCGWSPRLFRRVIIMAGEPWEPVLLPGVSDVIDAGDGWVAVEAAGEPLPKVVGHVDFGAAVALVIDGLRAVRALELAGLGLPDCRPERFVLDSTGMRPRVVLADLRGAGAPPTDVGDFVRFGLAWPPFTRRRLRREVPEGRRDWLAEDRTIKQWLSGLTDWL
jgi:hypothetical protein